MFNNALSICKVRDVKTPNRGTKLSAGIDFFVPNDFKQVDLYPSEAILIPSGIKVRPPDGFALIAFNKSGVALNKNLSVGACVVDEDYRGEVHLHVYNFGSKPVTISPGDKLVQFLMLRPEYSDVVEFEPDHCLFQEQTERGVGGFGSTGSN
jgi:dUTP pyrophosphatase